jgi:PIN domain nuclease of toxin-antitoxin system
LEALSVIIHLDTHVAVWLRMGDRRRLKSVRKYLTKETLLLSPYAVLELQVLHEIGRLRETARWIVDQLEVDHDVHVTTSKLEEATAQSLSLSFTRDPFDRLIAGHALASGATLLTADQTLLASVSCAHWA